MLWSQDWQQFLVWMLMVSKGWGGILCCSLKTGRKFWGWMLAENRKGGCCTVVSRPCSRCTIPTVLTSHFLHLGRAEIDNGIVGISSPRPRSEYRLTVSSLMGIEMLLYMGARQRTCFPQSQHK